MSVRFVDPETGVDVRSTEFAKRVLAASVADNKNLQAEILGAPDWRKWYLRLYAQVAAEEGKSVQSTKRIAEAGLRKFQSYLKTDSGEGLAESVSQGWDQDLVETFEIKGESSRRPISIPRQNQLLEATARNWVEDNLAEPGLKACYRYLDQNPNLDISKDLLFAVAGAAEFAPTQSWLSWGGVVAVVARPNKSSWQNLIAIARASGGTLLVPVLRSRIVDQNLQPNDDELAEIAGLDILQHYQAIASWMSSLRSIADRRFCLGLYAYTPKVEHIKVQAVQDSLVTLALEKFLPTKLALSWLATPTDSAPGLADIADASVRGFEQRSAGIILRDSLLGIFDAARRPRPNYFLSDSGERMALIDSSVQQQGPSYSFSKRTQRWRAYLAHYLGVRVSYAISPPARTESVLRHRLLRASYQGAPLFGVKPFEVDVAKAAVAAVLAHDLNNELADVNRETTTELHTHSAIHGGLWRIPYKPTSVWLAATALGFSAALKKGY